MSLPTIDKNWFINNKRIVYFGLGGVFSFLLLIFLTFSSFADSTIENFQESQLEQNENTIFYDISGQPFHVIRGIEDRRYVPLSKISNSVQKAVIAIEDARFYSHGGFDIIRIFGAIWHLMRGGSYVQGASTITQQLMKLSLLTPNRTISRKVREILMAIAIEGEYSKKEILEFYLNKVYLGHRNYGVENASQSYFGKSASELNYAEAAFIAGLIKKPEGYSPFHNLKKARERQLLVLKRLYQLGWISLDTYKDAVNFRIIIRRQRASDLKQAPYFTNHVIQLLKDNYSSDRIFGGGLRIYTTLDRTLQENMVKAVKDRLKRPRTFGELAGVSINPSNGFVSALIGGVDFEVSEFNRATQARRQTGSSFKPILYSMAIKNGIDINEVFVDEETSYSREVEGELEIYQPENYNEGHAGPITLAQALRTSNNVVSVKILKKLGIPRLNQTALKFGLDIPTKRGLCLALGCGEVSLLSMVNAYSAFANSGKRFDPVFILKVTDSRGEILEEYFPLNPIEVLTPDQNFQMSRLLQDVVEFGTGKNAKIEVIAGGKTGTSDQHRDAWFIGFTKDLVTGFWIGNDDNEPMQYEVGGATPARLWKSFMNKYPEEKTGLAKSHEGFEDYFLCVNSGMKATQWCEGASWYPLKRGSDPADICPLHTGAMIEMKICNASKKLATRYCPDHLIEDRNFFSFQQPTEFCDIHTLEQAENEEEEEENAEEEEIY